MRSGPRSVGRKGTSASLALVNGNRSMCCVFFVSSGLLRTSLRKADELYLDEAADDKDLMEMLSRAEVATDVVPEEKTVPVPPELFERTEPYTGLSYR